jgi:DNA-binding transcriptional regulator YiaG
MAKVRVTSSGVRKLRERLQLSQESLAKLLGVSGQAVYVMERRARRLKLRPATLSRLLTVREMGKRDVKKRLAEIESKGQSKTRMRKPAKKSKK